MAVCFVDLMRGSGVFSSEEAEDYMKMGVLNGLFVLGRSIGLIAHYLDQKRLRTGLYRLVFPLASMKYALKLILLCRHPWDDITYLLPTLAKGSGTEGRVEVSV